MHCRSDEAKLIEQVALAQRWPSRGPRTGQEAQTGGSSTSCCAHVLEGAVWEELGLSWEAAMDPEAM